MADLFSLVGNPVMTREGMLFLATTLEVPLETATVLLRLFQNDISPTELSNLADFTEADFDSYAEVALDALTEGIDDVLQEAVLQGVATSFTSGGSTTPNTIYGWYLVDVGDAEVIAAERFASPVTIDEAGDAITIVPRIVLAGRTP